MLKSLIVLSLIIYSLNVFASTDNTIFSCETNNGTSSSTNKEEGISSPDGNLWNFVIGTVDSLYE